MVTLSIPFLPFPMSTIPSLLTPNVISINGRGNPNGRKRGKERKKKTKRR